MKDTNMPTRPKIAVGLPTRGIIDTRTIEAILKNVEKYDHIFLFTDDKPLPDSRIDVTERFLASDADLLWWVDDDVVPTENWLDRAIKLDADIVTSPYYMQNGKTSVFYDDGEPKQCGFGCVLIKRFVYENTPQPWYRVNKVKVNFGGTIKWMDDPKNTWGGEDIWFYHQAVDLAGHKITVLDEIVPHLRIHSWGNKYLNDGVHEIYELDESGQKNFECADYDPKSFIDQTIKNLEKQ